VIDSIIIKNFKAFKNETVVLGHHTMFIGTHASGKTTILEALDVFFNHIIDHSDIRNKRNDVTVEIQIEENHYKKVFSPPHYVFNPEKSTGDFSKLQDYVYLYMPKKPYPLHYFINQCLSLHYTVHCELNTSESLWDLSMFSDHKPLINNHFFREKAFHPNQTLTLREEKKTRFKMLKIPEEVKMLLGVDEIEKSFHYYDYKKLLSNLHQAFFVSKQKQFINDFPHALHPLYKKDIQGELDTITTPLVSTRRKPFILVEGKTDVPWFEKGLEIIGRFSDYRVLPCGGYGNITFVETQLKKANYRTLVITDGDMVSNGKYYRLTRDIIEMYTDINYLNKHLGTSFKAVPKNKKVFLKALDESDEVVKRKLASYATNRLHKSHPFVQELLSIIEHYEKNQPKYYNKG